MRLIFHILALPLSWRHLLRVVQLVHHSEELNQSLLRQLHPRSSTIHLLVGPVEVGLADNNLEVWDRRMQGRRLPAPEFAQEDSPLQQELGKLLPSKEEILQS